MSVSSRQGLSSNSGGGSGSNNGNSNGKNNDKDDEEYEYEEDSPFQKFKSFLLKCIETSGITFTLLFVLGAAGIGYHNFYQIHVINKMSMAFDKGDEAFELTMHRRTTPNEEDWIDRPEQHIIDRIISGETIGRYFLITGEKGCGKSSNQ